MWTHRLGGGVSGALGLEGGGDVPGIMSAEHWASWEGVLTRIKARGCGDSRPTAALWRSWMCSLKAPWRAVGR